MKVQTELPFRRLAHYAILARLGQGGMGDVYKGYEDSLDRFVAIKVLPPELARQVDFVERFRSEATAAAKLIHPNVVQVFYIGEDQGHHFFAMQYIDGEPLTELLQREQRLSVDRCLEIGRQVIAGLALAHHHGIVHRDIKPGNVLLDRHSGKAVLADFGLAKSIAFGRQVTATGAIMGTADYISPEQAQGQPVDGRSDLYSLGVVLFQMLTGELPFQADTPSAMIYQHVHSLPPDVGELRDRVPQPLRMLIADLLKKLPVERPLSADLVALRMRGIGIDRSAPPPATADQSFLVAAPTEALEPRLPLAVATELARSWWNRSWERCLLLLGRHVPELVQQLQSTQQLVDLAIAEYRDRRDRLRGLHEEALDCVHQLEQHAEAHRSAANAESAAPSEREGCLRIADDLNEQAALQRDEADTIRLQLAKLEARLQQLISQRDALVARFRTAEAQMRRPHARAAGRRRLLAVSSAGLVGIPVTVAFFKWFSAGIAGPATRISQLHKSRNINGAQVLTVMTAQVECIAIASTPTIPGHGEEFIVGRVDGTVGVYRHDSDHFELRVDHAATISSIRHVAYSNDGQFIATSDSVGKVIVWKHWPEVAAIRRIQTWKDSAGAIVFSPDDSRLLTGGETAQIWDLTTSQELSRFPAGAQLSWSPASGIVISIQSEGVGVWNPETQETTILSPSSREANTCAIDSSGEIAYLADDLRISVWSVGERKVLRVFPIARSLVAFAPDARRAVTADVHHDVTLWDLHTGRAIQKLGRHADMITAVAISDNGKVVISASRDGTIVSWPVPPPPPPSGAVEVRRVGDRIVSVAYGHDGAAYYASELGHVREWKSGLNRIDVSVDYRISEISIAPSGRWVAYATDELYSKFNEIGIKPRGNEWRREEGPRLRGHTGQILAIAYSQDGRLLASGGSDGTVRIWNPLTQQELRVHEIGVPIYDLTFLPSSDAVILGTTDSTLRIWSWESDNVRELTGHEQAVRAVAASRSGNRLASGGIDHQVIVWDLAADKQVASFRGHTGKINAIDISEHGMCVISASEDTTVRVWSVESGEEIARFEGHTGPVLDVAMSKDGTRAITGGADGAAIVWKMPATTL